MFEEVYDPFLLYNKRYLLLLKLSIFISLWVSYLPSSRNSLLNLLLMNYPVLFFIWKSLIHLEFAFMCGEI